MRELAATWMRGGTSKCWVFDRADLDDLGLDTAAVLLRAFGSPDPRQVDGVGGATSTVSFKNPRAPRKSPRDSRWSGQASQTLRREGSCRRGLFHRSSQAAGAAHPLAEQTIGASSLTVPPPRPRRGNEGAGQPRGKLSGTGASAR